MKRRELLERGARLGGALLPLAVAAPVVLGRCLDPTLKPPGPPALGLPLYLVLAQARPYFQVTSGGPPHTHPDLDFPTAGSTWPDFWRVQATVWEPAVLTILLAPLFDPGGERWPVRVPRPFSFSWGFPDDQPLSLQYLLLADPEPWETAGTPASERADGRVEVVASLRGDVQRYQVPAWEKRS